MNNLEVSRSYIVLSGNRRVLLNFRTKNKVDSLKTHEDISEIFVNNKNFSNISFNTVVQNSVVIISQCTFIAGLKNKLNIHIKIIELLNCYQRQVLYF